MARWGLGAAAPDPIIFVPRKVFMSDTFTEIFGEEFSFLGKALKTYDMDEARESVQCIFRNARNLVEQFDSCWEDRQRLTEENETLRAALNNAAKELLIAQVESRAFAKMAAPSEGDLCSMRSQTHSLPN
jgi:chromosome segregation ATPase